MRVPHTGVLIANLGTPDEPTPAAVRRFLGEFLSDRRVIEIPRLLWLPLLRLIILPRRAPRVAHAYASIWTERGSPLRFHTQDQAAAMQQLLGLPVEAGFRYGNPSIESALDKLSHCQRIIVLAQYPQFSTTTTVTVWDAVRSWCDARRDPPGLILIKDYHDDPGYIGALANSVHAFHEREGAGSHLLMSFHGLPRRNVDLGDPYDRHCRTTAQALAQKLGLAEESWDFSYQSRFGPAQWLTPYTSDVLKRLGAQGLARLDVICPGFPADCLETLEEISLQGQEEFAAAGGGELRYIPALNADPAFAAALAKRVCAESGLEAV